MKLGLAFAASALVASTAAFVPVAGYAADYVMKISSPAPLTEVDPLSAWMTAFEAGVEDR